MVFLLYSWNQLVSLVLHVNVYFVLISDHLTPIWTILEHSHCEHHDFPTIPLHKLYKLRQIAPDFYRTNSNDSIYGILKKAFSKPDYYACMNTNVLIHDTH